MKMYFLANSTFFHASKTAIVEWKPQIAEIVAGSIKL